MLQNARHLQLLAGGKTHSLDMQRAVLAGLGNNPKSIPSKYLFNPTGIALRDRIAQLEDYYPARTESAIVRENASELAGLFPPGFRFVNIGHAPASDLIMAKVQTEGRHFPIDTLDEPFVLANTTPSRTLAYLPASAIGSFDPIDAGKMLRRLARVAGNGGGVLIGVDLKKSPSLLHQAYNDREGLHAALQMNLLERLNQEIEADFELSAYTPYAFYEPVRGCVETHLVSNERQAIHIGGRTFIMQQGESIRTARAYKYTADEFSALARTAGLTLVQSWRDVRDYCALMYFDVGASN